MENDNTNTPEVDEQKTPDGAEPKAAEPDNPEAQKPDGTIAAGGETSGEPPAEMIAYDFSGSLPEGWQADEQAAAEFSQIANEMKLDNAQANKLASYGYQFAAKLMSAQQAQREQEIQAWGAETAEVLGKDLARHKALCGTAMEALEKEYPDIRKALNETGAGNKLPIVMAFSRLGEYLQQDTGKIAGVKSEAQSSHDWYPNSHK